MMAAFRRQNAGSVSPPNFRRRFATKMTAAFRGQNDGADLAQKTAVRATGVHRRFGGGQGRVGRGALFRR